MKLLPLLLIPFCSLAAGEAAAVQPKLTLAPEQFEIQRSVSFSPQGRPSSEQQQCSLTFKVSADKRLRIPDFNRGKVRITVAETAAGESLMPEDQDRHNLWSLGNRFGRSNATNSPQFQLRLALKAPTKPCTMIKRLVGTIEASTASEKLRKVELKPVSKHAGQAIAIEGMADVELTLDRDDKGVKLTGPSRAFAALSETKFYTAGGDEIESRGSGSSSHNDTQEREFHVQIPADGSVVLFFYQDIKTITVPFEVTDLALVPEAASKPKNVIKSVEVEGTDPPPAKADNF